MLVIADSSLLVYLSRVGVLDLLATAFGEVVVHATVWAEVVDARPNAPGVSALRSASWLRVDRRGLPSTDLGLDPGQTAAILLAEALAAARITVDASLLIHKVNRRRFHRLPPGPPKGSSARYRVRVEAPVARPRVRTVSVPSLPTD